MQKTIFINAGAVMLSTTLMGCGKSNEEKALEALVQQLQTKQQNEFDTETKFLKDYNVSVLKEGEECTIKAAPKKAARALDDKDKPIDLSALDYINDVPACVKAVASNGGCGAGFYTTGDEGVLNSKDNFKCFCMPKNILKAPAANASKEVKEAYALAEANATCANRTVLAGANSYSLDSKDPLQDAKLLKDNNLVPTKDKVCSGAAVELPLPSWNASLRSCFTAVHANEKCGDGFYTTGTAFDASFKCKCMPAKDSKTNKAADNASCKDTDAPASGVTNAISYKASKPDSTPKKRILEEDISIVETAPVEDEPKKKIPTEDPASDKDVSDITTTTTPGVPVEETIMV
jgi:hypothetical protein